MKLNKKIATIVLLLATGVLFFAILYISLSMKGSANSSPSTTVKKTKASSITYNKTVNVYDQTDVSPTVPVADVPSVVPSENPLSPTVPIQLPTGLLAYNNPSVSPSLTTSPTPTNEIMLVTTITSTISPSRKAISSLPETGKYEQPLAIVGIATLLIFLSFVF